MRVLVVDDDRDTADSLAILLRMAGHEVWQAYSGADAIALAEAFAPNVLITDLIMPHMDGFDAARAVRPFLQQPATVIAVSGMATPGYRERAERERMLFLAKPAQPMQILKLLAALEKNALVGSSL